MLGVVEWWAQRLEETRLTGQGANLVVGGDFIVGDYYLDDFWVSEFVSSFRELNKGAGHFFSWSRLWWPVSIRIQSICIAWAVWYSCSVSPTNKTSAGLYCSWLIHCLPFSTLLWA